jgi:hypothetical protein
MKGKNHDWLFPARSTDHVGEQRLTD